MSIQIGCGQITWIRFGPKGAEWLAPEEDVLRQIAQAGYAVERGQGSVGRLEVAL